MSGDIIRGEVLKVTSDGREHYIARAQVVDITFHTERVTASSATAGDPATERFVARIVTLAPAGDAPYTIEVADDEARRLQTELEHILDRSAGGGTGFRWTSPRDTAGRG